MRSRQIVLSLVVAFLPPVMVPSRVHARVSDEPTISEIAEGLASWAKRWPNRIQVETRGKTAEGRPILLVRVTDSTFPDTDKQVALLTSCHAGSEPLATISLQHLTRWLITDDPAAAKIRQGVVTLIMPCVNPDGYDRERGDQRNNQRY